MREWESSHSPASRANLTAPVGSKTWRERALTEDALAAAAIVLDKAETARAKYGDIANKRWRFKLHIDGEQGWLDEVRLRTQYKLP